MGYNAKNYTTQGGDLTVIGGTLRVDGTLEYGNGAVVPGGGGSYNGCIEYMALLPDDEESKVTVEDFNDLILKLRESGLMQDHTDDVDGEPFTLSAAMTTASPQETITANNTLAQATYDDEDDSNTISVRVPIPQLAESEYGGVTGKWLCVAVGTGLSDITDVQLDKTPFTDADAALATSCGCDAGTFVIFLNVANVDEFAKVRTLRLDAEGYATTRVAVYVSDTSEE